MSAVRYVLARAAEHGIFEEVVPAAQRFDPLLRGSIRKGARRAFARASSSTTVTDEAHVLRVAFLQEANKLGASPDDVEGIKQNFLAAKALEPKFGRGRAFWPVTIPLLAGVLGAGIVATAILLYPTPRDRFAHTSLGEGMSEGLTDWVVGIGRRDTTRQEKGRDALMSKGVKRQIGDSAFNLLGTALEQTKAVAGAPTTEDAERETEALSSTLRSLDSELQNKKLPAFFDDWTDSATSLYGGASTNVWLLGYYVEGRATMVVGNVTVPVLRGRRMDNLNLEVGARGYESKVLDGWVIALDEVEEWVVANVVPSLGKGRGFAFGAKAAQEAGSEGRLDGKAGEKIRADLLGRAQLSDDDATELADLLSQRHAAFVRLAILGDELFEPRGLRASTRLTKALRRRQDEMDAKEISRIEDRLSRFDKPFERVTSAQAALDEIRIAADRACRKATACTFTSGDLEKEIGAATLVGAKAAFIASKLTMIARGDTTYLAFAESEMGPGGYATTFLVERELGLAPEWLGPYGPTDEAEHAQLGLAAFDKPAEAIRKAAESAYAKTFGAPMPTVTRNVAR